MANIFVDFLNVSITASYIILAVMLVRLIFKKIPRKFICALWAIAGIRLVLPFSIESAMSLIPSAETIAPVSGFAYGFRVDSGINAIDNRVNDYMMNSEMAQANGITPAFKDAVTSVAAIIWLAGIAAILVYGIISYIRVRKSVSTAVMLDGNVMQCETVKSPFILGVFRPKIYLPFGMDDDTRNNVIAHENAHLKRRDHWIKPLGFLILAVYWFNPLVWIAYVLLCRDIEMACDEKVCSAMDETERKNYATALLECSVNRRRIAACPLAFGEVGLKERVKGVMNYKKPAFWVIVLAVIACIVAAVCFLTNPEKEYDDLGYRLKITLETYEFTTSMPAESEVVTYSVNTGEKGKLPNGTKFEITETNLQTGELTIQLSGTPLYENIFDEPVEMAGITVIMNSEGVTLSSKEGTDTIYVKFEFIQNQTLESAVSDAITEHHSGKYLKGTAAFETHEIVETVSDKVKYKQGEKGTVTAYMYVSYGEYVLGENGVSTVGGSSTVAALTFSVANDVYTLTEYWEASDGRSWGDSIKNKMPPTVAAKFIYGDEPKLHEMNDKKAAEYFRNLTSDTVVLPSTKDIEAYILESSFEGDNRQVRIEWVSRSNEKIYIDDSFLLYYLKDGYWEQCASASAEYDSKKFDLVSPHKTNTLDYSLDGIVIPKSECYRMEFSYIFGETLSGNAQNIKTVYVDFFTDKTVFEKIDTTTENTEVYTTVAVSASEQSTEKFQKPTLPVTTKPEFTRPTYQPVDFVSTVSWAGYNENGEKILLENAEKKYWSPYSATKYHSVAGFETAEGFEKFVKATADDFQFGSTWDELPSFEQVSNTCNESFFEKNNLYIIYVSDVTTSVRFEVDMVAKQGDSLIILVDKLVPEVGDTAMGGWLITVEVSKEDVNSRNSVDALISEKFVFSQSSSIYTYTDSSEAIKPYFALEEGNGFVFMYSPLSSYYAKGEYHLDGMNLVMKTDDGKNTYVFKTDGDKYVFDAANSAKMPDYNAVGVPVPDGAVFEKN